LCQGQKTETDRRLTKNMNACRVLITKDKMLDCEPRAFSILGDYREHPKIIKQRHVFFTKIKKPRNPNLSIKKT
jgi:hypothetical protein